MFRKVLLSVALCMTVMSAYAQILSGSSRGPAYAFGTSGMTGIVGFPLDSFEPAILHSQDEGVRAAAFVEGSYYAISQDQTQLLSYDLESGTKKTVMELNGEFLDMAYDYSTRSLLMLQYNYPNPSSLVRLNLESGEITQLCSFEYSMCALTATPEGKVYVTDMWGEVYEADPSTGATTSIVKTNQYASSGVMRSMDYDVETGKLYYLHNSSYGGCTLYEIDTVQKTFKANGSSNGTYVGLYTGYTSAVPSSPAAPEGLTLTPAPDGSNSCVLTWTCPATTFNRQTLDKLAHATIYRDGEVIGTTENVAPGKEASYTDTDAATGIHIYKVTLSNADGEEGMFAIASSFVGTDVPAAPTDVKATVADGNTIVVTWTAPDKGLNGGFFRTDDLKYKVVRNDGVTIAEATAETTVTDKIEGAYRGYSYTVTALNGAGEGGSAVSNTAATGTIGELPLSTPFDNENEFYTWTVTDADADGNTWLMGNKWGAGRTGAEIYSTGGAKDDWLISPPVKLKQGVPTRLSFGAYCTYYCTENIEVRMAPAGTAPEDAVTVGTIEIKGSDGGYYGDVIEKWMDIPAAESDGNYSIYLHYQGGYSTQGVHINDFAWKENNTATVTGKVENFMFGMQGATVTVGEQSTTTDMYGNYTICEIPAGEYDVTASYQGYKTATEHVTLKAGDNVTVNFMLEMLEKRNVSGTVSDKGGKPVKGAKVSLAGYESQSAVTDAEGKYTISAYEADGYTLSVVKNNYKPQSREMNLDADKTDENFALDVDALPPYSVKATDNGDGSVSVSWDKPRSVNELAYDNGQPEGGYGYGSYFTGSQVVGTIFPGETIVNELKWWTVGGEGCGEAITLMLIDLNWSGKPTGEVLYQANVKTVDGQWNTFRLPEPLHTEKGFLFAIAGKTNVATDGGTADGTVDHPQTQVYTTTYNAERSYNYFDDTNDPSRHLLLRAVCENVEPDDATMPDVAYNVYRLPEQATEDEAQWTAVAEGCEDMSFTDVNIPSGKYRYAVEANYGEETSEVTFSEVVEHNMAASVSVSVTANSKPEHAEGAAVKLYNDTYSYTATVAGGKAVFDNVEKGVYSMSVEQTGFETYAVADLQVNGEETEFGFDCTLTQKLDRPANMDVLVDGSNARLLWNVQQNISDDFEGDCYSDFELNPAGDAGWQYVDNDGLMTWGFGNTTFPHMGEPMAAITFNSGATTPPLASAEGEVYNTAHSGNRALSFFASREVDGTTVVESDDYLISPELNAYRDFKFSFWARTYDEYEGYRERIRVGYSTTTSDLADFTWIDEELKYVPTEYTYYEYDIPKEAKYVALNSSSMMNFMLLVDDVFIGVDGQVSGNGYLPVNVLSYEVYLDGEKVADTNATEHLFTGLSAGSHTAGIVQKFDTGKSEMLSLSFDIVTTGIGSVAENVVAVYARDSRLYIEGDYSGAAVYDTAGAKMMELHGESSADISSIPDGVYIVKVVKNGGKTVSVKITK